jgi:ATP-dependent 26S proteasome regulatory subunit
VKCSNSLLKKNVIIPSSYLKIEKNSVQLVLVIVKATNGPRYVVGCRRQLDKAKLKSGTRVALDMTTLTIMRYLPREVDPLVYNMSHEDPGDVTYSEIGGLGEQIRELREVKNKHIVLSIHVTNNTVFFR